MQDTFYNKYEDRVFVNYNKQNEDGTFKKETQVNFFTYFAERKEKGKCKNIEKMIEERRCEKQTRVSMHKQYVKAVESGFEIKHVSSYSVSDRRRKTVVNNDNVVVEFVAASDFKW